MRRLIAVIHFTGRFDAMRAFYERGLRLPVGTLEPDWLRFDTAGAALSLHRMDDPRRQGTMIRFEADDLEATLEAFAARGVEPSAVTDFSRGRVADVWDPDGNLLSFMQPASPVPSGAGPQMASLLLHVADVAGATRFYHEQLGIPALVQSPWWTELDTGATRLDLHPRDFGDGGLRHSEERRVVCFHVPDLDALRGELEGRGFGFSGGPAELKHGRFAEVEDPDGNVVLFRESGPRLTPDPETLAEPLEDDAPRRSAMRPAGKQRARKTSRVAVKPAYKAAKAKPARPVRAKAAAASGSKRAKMKPATGRLKKAERRSVASKKQATATASRGKPVKRAAARKGKRRSR